MYLGGRIRKVSHCTTQGVVPTLEVARAGGLVTKLYCSPTFRSQLTLHIIYMHFLKPYYSSSAL